MNTCFNCGSVMIDKKKYYTGLIFVLFVCVLISCYTINKTINNVNNSIERLQRLCQSSNTKDAPNAEKENYTPETK